MARTTLQDSAESGLLGRIGHRVRDRRHALGWTLKQASARAGLSPRFFSQLEAGQANIAVGRLAAVAAALGLPLEHFVHEAPSGPAHRAALALLAGRRDDEITACLPALEAALGASQQLSVALIGLRGAGKSTVGAALARRLSRPFVELDELIEEAAGLALGELFALHGEAYYRRLTRECLISLLARAEPAVVALPGGIVLDEEAYALVRQRCLTAWLRARPEEHFQRVLGQGDRRPMAGRPNAMAELRAILAAREPLYGRAEIVLDTSARGVEALAETLAAEVEEHASERGDPAARNAAGESVASSEHRD